MSEIARHLLKVTTTRDKISDCLGFHGASIETVEHVLRNGVLPGNTVRTKRSGWNNLGELFYFPTDYSSEEYDSAFDGAVSYANAIACRHYLVKSLGLDLTNPIHLNRSFQAVIGPEENIGKLARLCKKPIGIVRKQTKIADRQEGVVFCLDKAIERLPHLYPIVSEAQHNAQIKPAHGWVDEGWKILTSLGGLDYSLICGLIPLGEREKTFMNNLERDLTFTG